MIYELIVIGGGPAGLAAAYEAYEQGLRDILIVERDHELGGILNQCIHNGFGLHYFKEELTGPEYAERFINLVNDTPIEVKLDTMVIEIAPNEGAHDVFILNREDGYKVLRTRSVILTMGCRERTRGAIGIPGARPSGIFTAGTAQRYINIEGFMVGRRVVILGSGDIGLIMARRMTLEGAQVLACLEINPFSGGLNRNIVQCLDDYDIPLYLCHTVTDILGAERLEQVVASRVDEHFEPIPGSEIVFDCDTLLLSVGLIPENELTRKGGIEMDPRTNGAVVFENMETSVGGIFACGNVVHVHDLVDYVTEESQRAGRAAAEFVKSTADHGKPTVVDSKEAACVAVKTGANVTYTVPQKIRTANMGARVDLFFRVRRTFTEGATISVCDDAGKRIAQYKRDYMVPGEMERIALPKKLIDQATGNLTVSVEERA